jgi:hypothetical protein
MTQKIEQSFYPLTIVINRKLRAAKLTAAGWRIWMYLVELEPWADKIACLETSEMNGGEE